MEEGFDTVGKRLRWAIERFGPGPRGRSGAEGSIRKFSETLELRDDLKGYGASRQMVHRYLKDETAPPEKFLRVAAEVLDPIRYKWLAHGEGQPTKSEAELQARLEKDQEEEGDHPFFRAVEASIPNLKETEPTVWAAFFGHLDRRMETYRRLLPAECGEYAEDDQAQLDYAIDLWDELQAPLREWSDLAGRELSFDFYAKGDYLVAMIHAHNLALQAVAPPGILKDGEQAWNPQKKQPVTDTGGHKPSEGGE